MDRRCGIADRLQGIDLVLHEGHEGRDHHVGCLTDEGRQLVAEALAAARGHHHQRVAAGESRGDRFRLQRPQPVEAPPSREDVRDLRFAER